jgi:hypothetical protein
MIQCDPLMPGKPFVTVSKWPHPIVL